MFDEYFDHLIRSLEERMEVIRRQAGKTDIEPEGYKEQIEIWFQRILQLVNERTPEFYVCELKVFQKSFISVESIDYVYFKETDDLSLTGITICRL